MRGFLLMTLALGACVPRAVNERIGALEARVAALEGRGPSAQPPPRTDGAAIREQFMQAEAQAAAGDIDGAQEALHELLDADLDPQSNARIRQTLAELSMVGRPVGLLADGTNSWIQGETEWAEGRHFVVFFETWCPHCRREVPLVDDRLAGRDASAVLLTRLTRTGTVESVQEFLADNDVTEPVAYIQQDIADRFGVSGVPAAAVIEDGVIIWRGHPARLEGELLDRVLPAL